MTKATFTKTHGEAKVVIDGENCVAEYWHFPAEPANGVNDSIEIIGIYHADNTELPYTPGRYNEAERQIQGAK